MLEVELDAQIIAVLVEGPRKSSVLVEILATKNNCSVQSVYAVLRKLRSDSVVLLHKKILSLSTVWIEGQSKLVEKAKSIYLNTATESEFSFGTLENGDRITYQFKNPLLLDEMWGHLFLVLLERVERSMPIMIYNPHSWFPIVRHTSEKTIFQSLFDNGFRAYFSFAGKGELDRDICKKFVEPIGHSFSTGVELGLKKGRYLNVVGDYVIEVELDETVTEDIGKYFAKYHTLEEANIKELQEIVSKRGRNKLTLSRNAHKAQRLRSRLAKDFFIPTESRRFV